MANPTNPPTGPSKSDLDMLSQQSALYAEMSSSVKSLAESINKIVGAVRGTTGEVEDLGNGLAAMANAAVSGTNDIAAATNNAINSSEEGARRAKATIEGLTSVSEEAGDAISRFAKELSIKEATFNLWEAQDTLEVLSETAKSFGESFEGAFSSANAKIVSMVSGVGVLAEGLFNIGKAVLAIPFQLLSLAAEEGNSLLNKGGGGDNSFQLALEDIREQFGNIATNEGKAVVDMYNNINQQQKDVAGSGLSMSTIFGKSSEALKAMGDVAKGLGAQFGVLKEQLSESAAEVAVLQKGMGLGNEELQAFGSLAISSGKPMVGFLRDAGKQAVMLGKQFGINSNLIGKDLAYMAANSSKFGKMTMQAMGTAATYARKLGLEIKDLEGVMGVFDDFESGAQASAKLSQAFGVQIDSMKMMQASSPAEQMSMLRDAFAKSGKSLEGLTRQQRKYLADTTGLGDKLEQALSPANAGADLGKIQDAATQAANDTNNQLLKQNELIKALATNIKKLPKEGGGGGDDEKNKWTSFIDAFKDGFMGALKEMKSFEKMTKNIAGTMNEFYDIGKRVFKAFLTMFPQLNSIFEGIADIFDPARFKLASNELVKIFENLFKGLKNPATAAKAFGDFYDSFIKWFKGLFGQSESKTAVEKGIEELVGYMGNALSGFVGFLIPKIADMISAVADFISDPSGAVKTVEESTQTGLGGAFSKALSQIATSIMEAWPVLEKAIGKLIDVAIEAVKPYLMQVLVAYFAYAFGLSLATSLVQAAGSALVAKAMQKLAEKMAIMQGKAILSVMGRSGELKAAQEAAAATAATQTVAPTIAAGSAEAGGAAASGAAATAGTQGIIATTAALDITMMAQAAGKLVVLSTLFLGAVALVILALAGIGKEIDMLGGEIQLLKTVAAVGSVVLLMAGLIFVSQMIQPAGAEQAAVSLGSTLPVMGAALLLALAMGGLAWVIKKLGVTPTELFEYGVVLAAIVGMISLVVLGAYALLALAPDGGATAAGTLAVAGPLVLGGLALLTLALMALMAIGASESEIQKGESIMMSLTKIVAAMGAIVLTALGLGFIIMNPVTLTRVGVGIVGLGVLFKTIVPAMGDVLKTLNQINIDPAKMDAKVRILKDVFSILDPMFKMVEKVMDQSTSWFTGTDTAAKNVKMQLESITGFFDVVLSSLGDFVKTVIDASASVSTTEEDIKRAEVFGKILGPVSDLAGSLMSAIGNVETNAEEKGFFGQTYKTAVKMSDQLTAIKEFLLGDDGLLKSITGVLPDIVKSINDITILKGMSPKELENLGKRAELVGTMVGAIVDLIGTFGDVSSAAAALGQTKTSSKGAAIFGTDTESEFVDMTKIVDFVPEFQKIFDKMKSMIPTLVESFNSLPEIQLKGAKDPTERVKSIGDAISAMTLGIKTVVGMFPSGTDINQMSTDLEANVDSMVLLSVNAGMIMESMLSQFALMPTLDVKKLEGIAKGFEMIGNISSYMDGISEAADTLNNFVGLNLQDAIIKTVQAVKEIDTQLATIETINLHSRIEKVGKALSLKPESLKIENKPVNINIQLHFTMDAKDLAMETTAMQARLSTQGQIKNPFNATVKPQ